ncbi:MAG: C10 family peptidase [Paludibacteraceae bacterium]|nr:C10 family peptidase [Paludibacteraceae bacterium]
MFNHKFLLIALCCLLSGTVFANERSAEAAAEIAAQFTNRTPELRAKRMAPCSASSMRLVHTRAKLNSSAPAFYIFNQEDNSGYVVVSGDDFAEDILMYSDRGTFDPESINPNKRFWLNFLQEEISYATATNAVARRVTAAETTTAIGPLLKNAAGQEIGWSQGTPYNDLCPEDEYDNSTSATGCVATAAAQVMYKWRHPQQGTGEHEYTWINYTTYSSRTGQWGNPVEHLLYANFGETTYDWDNMLPNYEGKNYSSAQATAVATLMYHCGIACDMDYGGDATGSASWTDDLAHGLVTYLGYKVTKYIATMSQEEYEAEDFHGGPTSFSPARFNVSNTVLKAYFNAELEAGRPILMGGVDYNEGGHEFVCDGRNTSGQFHINFGWEDGSNNYCTLPDFKPKSSNLNFKYYLDALIGVRPNTNEDPDPDDPDPDTPTGEVGDFVLVTNASTLAVGDEIIIVNEEASVALSTDQRNNNRGHADVTIVDNTISLTDNTDVQILTLEAGTVNNAFALYTGEGYLYAASSSSNQLKTQVTNNDNGSWEITISDGIATIIAKGTNTRNIIRYNKASNSQVFSCYSSGQEDVAIYRRVTAGPDDPDPDDPDPDDPDPDDPDPDTPTGEDGDFVLVTDAATLAVDDEVIIVNEEASVALSTTQNTNNRGQAAVDIVDNTIALPEETAVQILTLKAGTVEGTFAFYTGEGYLYAASSSKNYLRTQTTNDDNGSWEITISDGIATIIAQGENNRNWLRYNKANNGHLFSCYGSGQEDVAIYRRVIVEPDDPDPETPAAVEAVDSRESIIKSSKVLRDGVLYIIRGDRVYDVLGRPANR